VSIKIQLHMLNWRGWKSTWFLSVIPKKTEENQDILTVKEHSPTETTAHLRENENYVNNFQIVLYSFASFQSS
jgi:hypothetical protein